MDNSYKYFCNKECQYFPCHEIPEDGNFNCLFCYCPLYALGVECGGNFKFVTVEEFQIKDCSNCNFPHRADSYDNIIMKKLTPATINNIGIKEEFMFKANPPICKKYTEIPVVNLDINSMIPYLDSDYDPEHAPILTISDESILNKFPLKRNENPFTDPAKIKEYHGIVIPEK